MARTALHRGLIALILLSVMLRFDRPAFSQAREAGGGGSDASRFIKAMQGLFGAIRDIALVFEGKVEYVGPQDLPHPEGGPMETFQGDLLFRSDGAILLNTYERTHPPDSALIQRVESYINKTVEDVEWHPEDKRSRTRVESRRVGGAAHYNGPASPSRILYVGYFASLDEDEAAKFRSEGWEDVGGVRCLKLKLQRPAPANKTRTEEYWIDLARGGHPLKVEWHDDSDLVLRTHDIELRHFDLPGSKKVWLPVGGITETFIWNDIYYKEPIVRETYSIPPGSVRLNQGIPDGFFTAKNGGAIPGGDTPNPLRRAFDDAAAHPRPRQKMDRASIRERLDRALEEADRQSRMIEASSTARQSWSATSVIQVVCFVAGLAMVVLGIVALRRART